MNIYEIIGIIGMAILVPAIIYALWTVTMTATRDHHKKEKHA